MEVNNSIDKKVHHITLHQLEIFGQYEYKESVSQKKVFNGICLQQASSESFLTLCTQILEGQTHFVNRSKLERLIFQLSENVEVVTQTILDAFNHVTNNYREYIQGATNDGTFTIDDFLKRYQRLYDNTKTLRKLLSYYDSNMRYINNKSSVIILMKNMCLYNNVVNQEYKIKDKSVYLYELLGNYMEQSSNLDNIINIFKIYQFYNRLSNVSAIQDHFKDTFFNKSLSGKFTILNNSAKLISMLMFNVDTLIKKVSRESNTEKITEMSNQLRDILLMGTSIGDKDVFLIMYKNMLIERIFNYKSDFEFEQEVLKIFASYKEDPTLYAKIKYQITDAIISRRHDELFRTVNVRQRSEKFKDLDLTTFDRNICKFMIMRSFIVDQKDLDQYNVPDVICVFMAIFMGYYNSQFRDQVLIFLHNQSTGILAMKLKDDKKYNIKMTLLQMYVILTISKTGVISAKEISESLKMPLNKLGRILNSLIDCSLIVRGQGISTNANLLFSINWDCSFDETDIDIIPALKKWINAVSTQKQVPPQIPDVSTALLNAKIMISLVNKLEGIDESTLRTLVESTLSVKVPDMQFTNELKHLINSNKIDYNYESKMYLAKKSSSDFNDDSDVDSDVDSNGDNRVKSECTKS